MDVLSVVLASGILLSPEEIPVKEKKCAYHLKAPKKTNARDHMHQQGEWIIFLHKNNFFLSLQ